MVRAGGGDFHELTRNLYVGRAFIWEEDYTGGSPEKDHLNVVVFVT